MVIFQEKKCVIRNATINWSATNISMFLQILPAQDFAKNETSFQASLISY